MVRKRVAVLISGRGSNMMALIEAARQPDFPADIAVILSNRPDAAGLQSARALAIETCVVDHMGYGTDREAFERAVHAELEARGIDIICLAGFMRILTPWLVQRWNGRMLNIHPALLPSFKGLDTHARALAEGVKIHGVSVHFVVSETDSGPILAQGAVPVLDDDDVSSLAARVLAVEHRIYPFALRLLAQGRVRIVDGRCLVDGAAPTPSDVLVVPNIMK